MLCEIKLLSFSVPTCDSPLSLPLVVLSACAQIQGVLWRGRGGAGAGLRWVCVHKGDAFFCKTGILCLKKLEENFTGFGAKLWQGGGGGTEVLSGWALGAG